MRPKFSTRELREHSGQLGCAHSLHLVGCVLICFSVSTRMVRASGDPRKYHEVSPNFFVFFSVISWIVSFRSSSLRTRPPLTHDANVCFFQLAARMPLSNLPQV